MTSTSLLRQVLAAFIILSLALPTFADSSPEAQKWLDKLIAFHELGPFKVDYQADLDMSGLGQPIAGTLKGKLSQADNNHSRVELSLDLPGADGSNMSMSMLMVKDGEKLWTEMSNPIAGCQVTETSLAELEKNTNSATGFAVSPTSMDPIAQLENLSRTMDFEVLEKTAGTVTLRGNITEETRTQLGVMAPPGVDGFILVIDQKTGFPTQVRAEGETPFVTMNFNNLERLDAASLPEGQFDYSPSQGCQVR